MEIIVMTAEDLKKAHREVVDEIRQMFVNGMPSHQKSWIRTKELKKLLGLSDSQIQSLRINGKLPYTQLGKTYYYDLRVINEILSKNLQNKSCVENKK